MTSLCAITVDAPSCVVTVATDDFFPGALVTLSTYLGHHAHRDEPIIVLHSPERAPLSEAHRRVLESLSARVRCVAAVEADFWNARDRLATVLGTPDRLKAAFLVLEVFRARGPERVVAIDCDLLFLNRCDDLIDTDIAFGAVRAFDGEGRLPRGFFNSGVFTVGPEHLTGETFDDLLHRTTADDVDRSIGLADQAVLNAYFPPGSVRYLCPSLNVTKRHYVDDDGPMEKQLARTPARVLHYVNEKPWQAKRSKWQRRFSGVETIWHRAFIEAVDSLEPWARELLEGDAEDAAAIDRSRRLLSRARGAGDQQTATTS